MPKSVIVICKKFRIKLQMRLMFQTNRLSIAEELQRRKLGRCADVNVNVVDDVDRSLFEPRYASTSRVRLCLEVTDQRFDRTVLIEFRKNIVPSNPLKRILDQFLSSLAQLTNNAKSGKPDLVSYHLYLSG